MKAPAFWYRTPGLAAGLLAPLGLLWRAAGRARRTHAVPYRAQKPVICVGNIVAGGAGKTPTALAIARLLQQGGHNPVFVTRGYGGRQHGPLRVDPERHDAADVGDEALLLARVAPTWIGRDRAATLRAAEPFGSHVILDDGLQNPHLRPDISFLVIDGEAGIGNGCLIPAGPLREPLEDALQRTNAVVLIGARDAHNIAARVSCPVLRATVQPDPPENFPRTEKFYAFAGIGRPEKFYATCRDAGLALVGTEDFPDHHAFGTADLARLWKKIGSGIRLLTTEKDWVRLPPDFRAKVTALPVKLVFTDEQAVLNMLSSRR